jgi:hypothetical protein
MLMATKKKVTKGKALGAVTRRLTVPAGTRQINLVITIGKPVKKGFKMAKGGIQDDPLGGGG